jgi:hypothetical protein
VGAEWVETNHADDVVVVYTDHDHDAYNHFANSEEAVALLEQRLDELVAEEIAAAGDEEVVRPGGACQCTDGSDYAFFVRHADPTKVMVTLGGGGACFSTDCDEGTPTEPPAPDGIFDLGAALVEGLLRGGGDDAVGVAGLVDALAFP